MKKRLFWAVMVTALLAACPKSNQFVWLRTTSPGEGIKQTTVAIAAHADRMAGTSWGHSVDGLRARVLVPTGRKKIGEQVPIVIMFQNQGISKSADGSVRLAPILSLDVYRNGWRKSVFLPVHDLGSYLGISLEKGKEFYYTADLARMVDLDVPGKYLVIGGYDSSVAKFKGAWRGGKVTSAPFTTITLLPAEHAVTSATEGKQPGNDYEMQETECGQQVRGLRCKVGVRTGTYWVAEPIATTITIENLGTPDSADGRAQLFPHLDLWVRRAGWEKHVTVHLNIKNRLCIKKGEKFTHSLDLSETVDLDVPGEYAVSAGHSNYIVTDLGDWTGTVRSPFLKGIVMLAVARDKANDLLFIGGDFNNQPFSAYERVEKKEVKTKQNDRQENLERLPVQAAGETYTVNGWEIEVSLVPDKTEIMIGEPIYLSFRVHNHSDQDLQLIEGGDYRNRLGRPESYSITTIREDGKLVPNPDAGQSMGGERGPQKIPAKDSFVRKLFLPNWARFEESGQYLITCKRALNISRHTPNRWDWTEKTIDVDVEVSTKIKVTLLDKKKMGEVIATLGNAMLGDDFDSSEKAARALAYVNDEGAIEYLVKAIDARRYGLKFTAIGALSKFNNDLALQGLKKAMTTKAGDIASATTHTVASTLADNIRHTAACALAKSKHPEAISLLLSMWKDKAYGVRITVLHALGRMNSAESLSMLRKMTHDENELVSREAERYLKIRMAKSQDP